MRRMKRIVLLGCLALVACGQTMNTDGGIGGGRGGGTGGGGGTLAPFSIFELDPTARDATYFAMALDPVQERIGVAYFTPVGTTTEFNGASFDAGVERAPDFHLKYVEWKQGALVGPPETLRIMQRKAGVAIAFDPSSGEPVVAFLGGANGFVQGQSIFWFQSDAVLSRRNAGTWTETTIATTGDQVTCGNPVSDRGLLVGLWPALAFDAAGKLYFGYRDGHDGQFPMQDWAGSDVEVWDGMQTPSTGRCVAAGGNNKKAYGGHLQMVIGANDQPAVIHDQMFGTSDSNGINVNFQKRNADGSWTVPGGALLNISNTQTGASLAWDPVEGYGIAVTDNATNQLSYINSANGVNWSAVDPVFGSGSGGWFPSLAMDPINHEPAIAFYFCSPRSAVAQTGCTTTEDELRIIQRVADHWQEKVVDTGGGHSPKIGFLSTGKRIVVYRTPPAIDPETGLPVTNVGALKLAVER